MSAKRLAQSVVFALALVVGGSALAASHTGTIRVYHLNNQEPGRGPCVQMNPAMPGTGWGCVYTSHLSQEMSDLLLQAYLSQKT